MKTITLTESEIRTLHTLLSCNPCRSHCIHEYQNINCFDLHEDGRYKCELMRNRENIFRKLEK